MIAIFITTLSGFCLAAPKYSFVDASLWDVLNTLAEEGGYHLIVGGDQALLKQRRITVTLDQVTPKEAIEQILQTNGYLYDLSGSNLLISTLSQDMKSSGFPREGKVLQFRYLSAKKVKEIFAPLYDEVKFQEGARPQSLIIWGRSADLWQIEDLTQKLDQPSPRLLIEAQVIEVSESGGHKLGVTIAGEQPGVASFALNNSTGKIVPTSDIQMTLHALIDSGDAKILARPRIATLDGEEALIDIGSKIPYAVPSSGSGGTVVWSVQYIDAGVKLEILPRVGKDNFTIQLKPEVSAVAEWRTTAAGDFPVISTRQAQTTVAVKNKESIVIGGLINDSKQHNNYRIPILSSIPFLGWFFQYDFTQDAKTEIVFVVTPKLV